MGRGEGRNYLQFRGRFCTGFVLRVLLRDRFRWVREGEKERLEEKMERNSQDDRPSISWIEDADHENKFEALKNLNLYLSSISLSSSFKAREERAWGRGLTLRTGVSLTSKGAFVNGIDFTATWIRIISRKIPFFCRIWSPRIFWICRRQKWKWMLENKII